MSEIRVPVSVGELIDKITILEIKSQRMTDETKLHNVRTELALLSETWRASPFAATDIRAEWDGLREVNGRLWDIEDRIRDKERDGAFDPGFIELARAVYVTNDERAAIKKRINAGRIDHHLVCMGLLSALGRLFIPLFCEKERGREKCGIIEEL